MRKPVQAAALIAALLAAPLAIAQGLGGEEDAEMPNERMMMGDEQMEGGGGMMGMMPMMQQMSEMMETCNEMMQAMMERSGMPGEAPSDAPVPDEGNG